MSIAPPWTSSIEAVTEGAFEDYIAVRGAREQPSGYSLSHHRPGWNRETGAG